MNEHLPERGGERICKRLYYSLIDTYWHVISVTASIQVELHNPVSFHRHPLSATVDTSTISLDMTIAVGSNSSTYLIHNSNVCYGGTMELTGTFEFSHVEMVVINKKDVYKRELVGKKQVPLWHKEHCPKVYLPDDIKEMIQGYLKSRWHRVNPSGNTINIYHKTKAELDAEKKAKEKLDKQLQNAKLSCRKLNPGEMLVGVALHDIKPGQLISTHLR